MQTTTFPIKQIFFFFLVEEIGRCGRSRPLQSRWDQHSKISSCRGVGSARQYIYIHCRWVGRYMALTKRLYLTLSELPTYLVVRPAKFITSAGNCECSQMCHITKLDLFRQEIKIKFMDIECASYTRDATNSCISVTSVWLFLLDRILNARAC